MSGSAVEGKIQNDSNTQSQINAMAGSMDALSTMIGKKINNVATITDLRALTPTNGMIAFMIGKNTLSDNLGGFYRFDTSNTADEDSTYSNVITSSVTGTGRWVRIFQKVKVFSHGILVNNGGVKSFWAPGVTDATGKVVTNLTEDNTPTGTPLFNEVWLVDPKQSPTQATSSAPMVGAGVVSADNKVLTSSFSQSETTTLASTLLAIAGTIIKGLRPVPANIAVQIKVEGV